MSKKAVGREVIIFSSIERAYSPNQCSKTLTVGELIELLQGFPPEKEIYLGNDFRKTYWYTYEGISEENAYDAYVSESGDVTILW